MSSEFQQLFASGAHDLHQQHFGEADIMCWPLGVAEEAYELERAEWEVDQPTEVTGGGRHQQIRGRLLVDAQYTIGKRDVIVIRGRTYTVQTIGVDQGDGGYEVVLESTAGDWRKGAREAL